MIKPLTVAILLALSCGCSTPKATLDMHGHSHDRPIEEGIVEDWETALIAVGSGARAALGITDPDQPKDVTDKFRAYGIAFSFQWRAEYNPRIGHLVVTNYPDEICKIRGIVYLWDHGYRIEETPTSASTVRRTRVTPAAYAPGAPRVPVRFAAGEA